MQAAIDWLRKEEKKNFFNVYLADLAKAFGGCKKRGIHSIHPEDDLPKDPNFKGSSV